MNKIIINKTIVYQELITKQRKELHNNKKLSLNDIKRISNSLSNSIFTDECSLWTGYIHLVNDKSAYINFFYNGKKQALNRLLYYNFVDDLNPNEYLKYSCVNKGKCCSIKHIKSINKTIQSDINNDISGNVISEQLLSNTPIKIRKKITVEL
jgi:hypothetical protein